MVTCTKKFADIPFAHRQHTHTGHCRFIHGHNWSFIFTFGARELDACGFVIDFGGPAMKTLKQWLNDTFDHKLLLNTDDPFRDIISGALLELTPDPLSPNFYAVADILVVPDASCEGLARWVFAEASRILEQEQREVWIAQVVVEEDSKNSATFRP